MHCTGDTVWNFVRDQILRRKEAVQQWMATAYAMPPQFSVERLIAEGDFVTAIETICIADGMGASMDYQYCDAWHFRDGKMAELRAFVIRST